MGYTVPYCTLVSTGVDIHPFCCLENSRTNRWHPSLEQQAHVITASSLSYSKAVELASEPHRVVPQAAPILHLMHQPFRKKGFHHSLTLHFQRKSTSGKSLTLLFIKSKDLRKLKGPEENEASNAPTMQALEIIKLTPTQARGIRKPESLRPPKIYTLQQAIPRQRLADYRLRIQRHLNSFALERRDDVIDCTVILIVLNLVVACHTLPSNTSVVMGSCLF